MYRKIALYMGLFTALYLIFRFLLPLVIPFVVAAVVAILYYPFIRKIFQKCSLWEHNTGQKKRLLAIAVVVFYAVILIVCMVLIGYLCAEAKNILLNYPFYEAKALCLMRKCCCQMDVWFQMRSGVCFAYLENWMTIMKESVAGRSAGIGIVSQMTLFSVQTVERFFGFLFAFIVTIIATFFLILDYEQIRERLLQNDIGRNICNIVTSCKHTLKTYIKAQGRIMLLDGIVCTIAFCLIGQPYYVFLGPLTAVVDALPILGAGIILIPYVLYLIFTGSFGKAVIIGIAYVCCVVIRQITEPKMIGKQIGLRPIYTIMSMYIGFRLFGVAGFLLGPIGVLIVRQVVLLANKE